MLHLTEHFFSRTDIRAFIMRTLSQPDMNRVSKRFWERSIKYETENGTIANIMKLEKMREEAFSDGWYT